MKGAEDMRRRHAALFVEIRGAGLGTMAPYACDCVLCQVEGPIPDDDGPEALARYLGYSREAARRKHR